MLKALRSFIFFGTLSFSIFLSSVVFAAKPELTVPGEECRCDKETKDVYEEPMKFNFGPHAGACVDSCRFRPSRFLGSGFNAGIKNQVGQKNQIVITNVLHKGEYWTATVPVDQVDNVSIAFEEFIPRVSHVFLSFHFPKDRSVILKSQRVMENGKVSKETTKIQDLVVSSEGVPPQGGNYSLLEGYKGNYILAHRLLSLDATMDWMVTKYKHEVIQYPVQLDSSEMKTVLKEALEKTDRESFKAVYYLFTNNCATSALKTLQAAKPLDEASWLSPLAWSWDLALPIRAPLGTQRVLQARGWVDLQKRVALSAALTGAAVTEATAGAVKEVKAEAAKVLN